MSKKRETYGSITRKLNALLERQEKEKERIARVMADALLTDRVALRIGDFTDTELRKVMRGLTGYLDESITAVESGKLSSGYQIENGTQEPSVNVPDTVFDEHQIPDTVHVQ